MEKNYSYRQFFQNLCQAQKPAYEFKAESIEEAAQWKEQFRAALYRTFGCEKLEQICSMSGFQVSTELIGQVQEAGYCRYKYVMETLPGVWMPFYMMVPDGAGADSRADAMLVIPAHGANKNTVCGVGETEEEKEKIAQVPTECYGLEFVKRGYVVFCPDPPGYGERNEPAAMEEGGLQDRRKSSLSSSCKNLALTAEALGLSLPGLELWDLERLLDFACTCDCIREKEGQPGIGCAGFSGGGQYAMWLAAMDERIQLCVISGYVHSYYESMLECHLCPCNYAPGLWQLCELSDVCSLIAPRPLFAENGTEDIENGPRGIDGPKEQVEKIRRAYRLYQEEDKVVHCTPQGPHRWYGLCYDFVKDKL